MRRRRVSSAPGAGRVRDSTICRMSAAAWWSPAVRRARSSCRATMASVPLPSASAALRARTNRYRGRTPAYPPAASISSSRVVRRLRGSRRTTIGLHRTGACWHSSAARCSGRCCWACSWECSTSRCTSFRWPSPRPSWGGSRTSSFSPSRARRSRCWASSELRQRDPLLRLVLALLVFIAHLALVPFVRRHEQHLRDALVGVDLGGQGRRVRDLERHEPFPLRLERGDVGDDAAARVRALPDADRQHVAGDNTAAREYVSADQVNFFTNS